MSTPQLPQSALNRLQGSGSGKRLFSGNILPRDLLNLRQQGFKPQGLVFGASVYSLSTWNASYMSMGELTYLTDGYGEAFYNALTRLEEEASALGADGVIDAVPIFTALAGEGLIEVRIFGTAIEHSSNSNFTNQRGKPFVTHLSAAEFCGIYRQGYIPTGLCYGFGNVPSGYSLGAGSWSNMEEPYITQSIYKARNLAMTRAVQWAEANGATGIVGLNLEMDYFTPDSQSGFTWLICTAAGTTIRQVYDAGHSLPKSTFYIPLNDKTKDEIEL